MNQKELQEIKRRLRSEKTSITHIYGCYVNTNKEVISYVDAPLGRVGQEEAEEYLGLMKKTLSGRLDRNLIDLVFSNEQVQSGDEHRALMALRAAGLKNEADRNAFFQRVINSLEMEENYLILMAYDTYDVFYRSKDGDVQQDASDEVYSYLLFCVCPVKSSRQELHYCSGENEFHLTPADMAVGAPETGFLFPAFDDRRANIYNALLYSKDAGSLHQELIDTVFHTEPPMTSSEQKESFEAALTGALEGRCSYSVLQTVHEQLREKITEHQDLKDPEPLSLSAREVGEILHSSGINEEQIQQFKQSCDEQFGQNAVLNPENIIDSKKFEVATPDIRISVDPDKSFLLETRIIEGRKYILIPADGGVEVNGLSASV